MLRVVSPWLCLMWKFLVSLALGSCSQTPGCLVGVPYLSFQVAVFHVSSVQLCWCGKSPLTTDLLWHCVRILLCIFLTSYSKILGFNILERPLQYKTSFLKPQFWAFIFYHGHRILTLLGCILRPDPWTNSTEKGSSKVLKNILKIPTVPGWFVA